MRDFGATADDDTEDTEAFQDAVDAARGGGTVYVPPGEYLIRRVRIRENTTIYGEGEESKLLHAPWNLDEFPTTSILLVRRADDVTIRDLGFSGNLDAMTYTDDPGSGNSDLLDLKGGQRVTVEGCYFEEPFTADVIDVDLTDEAVNYSISDNYIDMRAYDRANEGILMRGRNHQITNNYVIGSNSRTRAAIAVDDGSTNNKFQGNVVEDSYRAYDIRGDPDNPTHPFVDNEAVGTFESESNLDGAIVSNSNDIEDDVPVAVETLEPTNIGATSTLLRGNLVELGGNDTVECYFEWRQTGADEWNATTPQTLDAPGEFSQSLTDLESDTEYEYLAIAESDADKTSGVGYTFVTATEDGSSTPGTVVFQAGVDGYDGAADTYLQESQPDENYGAAAQLLIDGSNPGRTQQVVQGLLRFDSIVGSDTGQVPSGGTVTEATLTLEITNSGSGGSFHPMLVDWSDTDTWNTLDGGIQNDSTEAETNPDFNTGRVDEGTLTLDVTDRVQAWVDGQANNGWGILPNGTNGWEFYSAEGATPPKLTVTYE
ncbi:DNRLRE domain-containing protein [Haloarcula marina]|uniref:DNRLRE domain-containing protein n=1 Tax=Haloarcula marina TaxID=2961574 RepID=UPI0020B86F62|nr:DNRLRE domain-containing protein [Halomicroarcula marina]